MKVQQLFSAFVLSSLCFLVTGCAKPFLGPGTVLDEAMSAGRVAQSFPAADEDFFRDMDGRMTLTAQEVKGRNMWIVWSGGNDRFWDAMTNASFGAMDLLKTISSHASLKFSRDNRWNYLGLVNEPCFEKATAPDPQRFGLWLDKRKSECGPDPFENEKKYPGVSVQSYSGEKTLYRVRVGGAPDIGAAQKLAAQLKNEDLQPFVVRVN